MANTPLYSPNQPDGTMPAGRAGYADSPASRVRGTRKQVERIVDVLYRRRWIIVACFLLAGVISATMMLTQTPTFEANAMVMLDLNRMPGGQQETVVGNTPFVRSERTVATELFILQNSPAIARRVNERLQEAQANGANVSFPPRGGVQFSSAGRTVGSALRITAVSPDPEEAALLANVYAEEYVRQTQDASRSYVSTSREFLEEQEGRRREELREAEDTLEEYLRRTGTVGLSQEGAGLVGRIVGLQTQRDEAGIELQMREAQLASIERELASIQPQLAGRMASTTNTRLQAIDAEIASLIQQRQQMRSYDSERGETDPRQAERLQQIDRRISALENEKLEISDQYVDEVMSVGGMDASTGAVAHAADLRRRSAQERIALEGLQARIGSMNQRLGQYQGQLNAVPELSTDLARLERDRQHAEQMYQYVVQRLQDTRIAEESEPGYARVLRHAGVPVAPLGPDRWRNLGMGLLFGLLIGITLAIVRDRLDTRIYKPEQLQETGLNVLGVIPNLEPVIQDKHGKALFVEREGDRLSTSVVTLHDPLSSPAEAYRHLRTSIQFSRMDQMVQKVLVTSAAAGDGKSTTAANLAVTMAQAHRRTILIDADLRRPNQHKVFGKSEVPGLAQLLSAKGPIQGETVNEKALTAWLEQFRSPQHPSLWVLPAGDIEHVLGQDPDNPAELLGSRRMRDALEALCGIFDVVVIDAPPVLAATDAVLLSTQADATLLVARAGQTKEADLEYALGMLNEVGARVPGILLNGFELSMAYGYRYSYGHYTKYGPYSKYGYHRGSARSTGATA
jgi:polysaccharide biosynthesis transport protein